MTLSKKGLAMTRTAVRINSRPLAGVLVASGILALSGCASVPHDAGFSQVQQSASNRLNKQVHWTQGGPEDRAGQAVVQRLLLGPLTADKAVQIALLNNPGLQAEFENLGISQANLIQAGLLANPVFSAAYLYSPIGSNTSLGVAQDFLNVFTLAARKRIATAEFDATRLKVTQRVMDLTAQVRIAYYSAVANAQTLGLDRQIVSSTQAAAELAERQVQAGTLSRRDQYLHQTFYAQQLVELQNAETQLVSARERLNRLLGLWGADTEWQLPDRLPDVPTVKVPLDHIESYAIAHRLDLAAAQKQVDALAYGLGYTRRYRYLGLLGIGVNVTLDGIDRTIQRGPELVLGMPLFDRGQGRIRGLEASLRQSEQSRRQLAVDIRSQVRDTANRLQSAQQTADYFRRVLLPLQQQTLAENQRFYNGMLIGVYDLLLSKQNEINTARQYVLATRDYWTTRAELERVGGGPLAPAANAPSAQETGQTSSAPVPDPAPTHRHGVQ
ncbi:MAG: TolC family protein [Gammaproteobacteria bacterium]|nr:TolC family protein [Gammaproteobacteria bacterium]